MATTQKMLDVSEMGAKSKEELLGLASEVGLNDTTALATLHKEDLLSRLFKQFQPNRRWYPPES